MDYMAPSSTFMSFYLWGFDTMNRNRTEKVLAFASCKGWLDKALQGVWADEAQTFVFQAMPEGDTYALRADAAGRVQFDDVWPLLFTGGMEVHLSEFQKIWLTQDHGVLLSSVTHPSIIDLALLAFK
eukprot:1579596-Karenia_brevis.AAC.1